MHGIPGLHPGVVAFARRLVAAGFTVYMPSLFGVPGRATTGAYTARSLVRASRASSRPGPPNHASTIPMERFV